MGDTWDVRVIEEALIPARLLEELGQQMPSDCGGVATFPGRMRAMLKDDRVGAMNLDPYRGMTERVRREWSYLVPVDT